MSGNLLPNRKITILYSNEISTGNDYEIKILQGLEGVDKVIVADYRFKMGDDQENSRFLSELAYKLGGKSDILLENICKYIDIELEKLIDYYVSIADCIFIAGSKFDPSSEHCLELPTRVSPDIRREIFEISLIKRAKKLGIPLLAICAGSWRLASAYGGKTYAVKQEQVHEHEQWETVRHPDKTTSLKPKTMLQQIHVSAQKNKSIVFKYNTAQKQLAKSVYANNHFDPFDLNVNTTHWRVTKAPEEQVGSEFSNIFRTSAIDKSHGTVEAYESIYGTPIMAVQFHPEYTIPEVRKSDGSTVIVDAYKTHRSILTSWVETGMTYNYKRELMREIKNKTLLTLLKTASLKPRL